MARVAWMSRLHRTDTRLPSALALAALAATILSGAQPTPAPHGHQPRLPVTFEPNRGQFDPAVRFASRGRGYTLYLTQDEAVLALRREPGAARGATSDSVLRLSFDGAVRSTPSAAERAPGLVHYLIGRDPSGWRTDIPLYSRVEYDGLYPGIDLVYYGVDGVHEYDLVVAPGADPSRIALRLTGSDGLTLAESGDLTIHTSAGPLTMAAPVIYQVVDGTRRMIRGRYVLPTTDTVAFAVDAFDPTAPLVIDPQLIYGTFLGGTGSGIDLANGVAVDDAGSPYIVGTTDNADFPVRDPLQERSRGSSDAVVVKLTPDGQLVWATYLGGNGSDGGADIDVRADGTAYVLGDTTSEDFPVRGNAYQSRYAGNLDAFVVALTPEGRGLALGTYLGGGDSDAATSIQLTKLADDPPADAEVTALPNIFGDVVFVAGSTRSPNYPTVRPTQATRAGERDGFVTVLDRATFNPIYSSYVGSPGDNRLTDLGLNRDRGDLYVKLARPDDSAIVQLKPVPRTSTAVTPFEPPDFSFEAKWTVIRDFLKGRLESLSDEVIEKLAQDAALEACDEVTRLLQRENRRLSNEETLRGCAEFLFGGKQRVGARPAIAPSLLERAELIMPLTGCAPVAPARTCNERGVLFFLDADLSVVTTLNYGGQRVGRAFVASRLRLDATGHLHVIGSTSDATLPVVNAVQGSHRGSSEGFVATLSLESNEMTMLSYLGGSSSDMLSDMAIDRDGNRWIVGYTLSADFPVTRSGVQPELRGRQDWFIVKITP